MSFTNIDLNIDLVVQHIHSPWLSNQPFSLSQVSQAAAAFLLHAHETLDSD